MALKIKDMANVAGFAVAATSVFGGTVATGGGLLAALAGGALLLDCVKSDKKDEVQASINKVQKEFAEDVAKIALVHDVSQEELDEVSSALNEVVYHTGVSHEDLARWNYDSTIVAERMLERLSHYNDLFQTSEFASALAKAVLFKAFETVSQTDGFQKQADKYFKSNLLVEFEEINKTTLKTDKKLKEILNHLEDFNRIESRSTLLDSFPSQDRGFNFGIEDGKIVYRPSLIDPNSITARLHASLLKASFDLQHKCRTIGNKSQPLLDAIDGYHKAINHEVGAVDAVDVYSNGLDLDTEYKEALEYGGDKLGEYPELNRNEKSAMQKVIRRHAAYIQSTPEGAYFTDAEERYLRSLGEEKKLSKEVKRAAEELLNRPDIIDPEGAQRIYDNADPPPDDPNAGRKKTLSRIGLRNFLIVVGIGTAISTGSGAAIGSAVGSVADPAIAGATGTFAMAGMGWVSKRIIQETKAFNEFTENFAIEIDDWLERERPKLKPLTEFFINTWEIFKPTVDSPGIDKWFEQIHAQAELDSGVTAIAENKSNELDTAVDLVTLGEMEQIRGNLDTAVDFYLQALKFNEQLGDKLNMAKDYYNLGHVEQSLGDIDVAVAYYQQALKIYEQLGQKESAADNYRILGIAEQTRGNLDAACGLWRQAYDLFVEVEALQQVEQVASLMSKAGCVDASEDGFEVG